MKRVIVFSCLTTFLFADSDYIPLSKLSDDKKIEYNFMDAKKTAKEKIKKEEEAYPVKSMENSETSKEIVSEKTEKIQENETTLNKDFVKEYKKDNILQNIKKDIDDNKDFSLNAKVAYTYLKTELSDTNTSVVSETSNEILPEILLSYKNNIIKSDILKSNVSDKNTGTTLDTNWYKVAYLYRYLNANVGVAYNKFGTKSSIFSANLGNDVEEFPTIELSLKNVDHQFQADYGVSYGKNNNINYAYEYYLNFGYRLFNNESLVFIAGYKNKTIEDDISKLEYKGPLIGVSSTF